MLRPCESCDSLTGRKRSMTGLLIILLCLCAGLAPTSTSQAFWPPFHKKATKEALAGIVNAAALADLAEASTIGDTGEYNKKSQSHYDNCVWDLGREWILEHRAGAAEAACQYFTTGEERYRIQMYDHLGLVFHAAQDFYAHSNWIEHNPDGATADLEGPKPDWWQSGTWPHDYPQSSQPGAPTHGELNKDHPLRRGYDEAFNDAVAETRKQFALFQAALQNRYPDQAGAILGGVFGP